MSLTVACVLKSGGIYDATWVARLKAGVAKHLPTDHRFVCLSDVDVPCERIPLEHDWPGWWSKIEVFKLPEAIYFDLDTAIVGRIDEVAARGRRLPFTILRDFYRLGEGLGSGVMAWSPHFRAVNIYERFAKNAGFWMDGFREGGDQAFIEDSVSPMLINRWQDVVPGQFVSYKVHCCNGVPPDARVVCLHGRPKFADMPVNDPVRVAWEMAA